MTTSYAMELDLGKVPLGHAWIARDKDSGQPVVIKKIPLEAIGGGGNGWTRLVEETRALSRIAHPNIASTLEVGTENDHLVMVTMRPQGRRLAEIVEDQRPLTAHDLRRWVLPLLEGLAIAHASGVVHRHVHEDLIIVDPSDTAVLTGGALTLDQRIELDPIPPEVLNGGAATPMSDQFLVGAMLQRLVRNIEVIPALDIVISRAMADDVKRRFPDIIEMQQVLDQVLVHASTAPAELKPGVVQDLAPTPAPRSFSESMEAPRQATEKAPVVQDLHTPIQTKRRWLSAPVVAASVVALVGLAWILVSQVEQPAAAPAPERMTATAAENPMRRVSELLNNGQLNEAAAKLEVLLAENALKDPTPALDALGTIRLQEGDGDEASGLFEQALARHAAESLYYKLSLAQASTGRDDEARRTIDEGLRLFPDSQTLQEARFHLGGA